MTEKEWLTCSNAHEMINCLLYEQHVNRRKAGRRKLRHFGCSSCRLIADPTMDPRSLAAIEFMERAIDHGLDAAEMASVKEAAHEALRDLYRMPDPIGVEESVRRWAMFAAHGLLEKRADGCASAAWRTCELTAYAPPGLHRQEKKAYLLTMAHLLRDIFGNPFRPVALDPNWLTTDVRALARGVYDEKAFDRMPILADALQDAGCDNDDTLSHCRDPKQTHARGCWVIDLLLGKG